MGGFPAWPSIARDLSAGVFVVKGSIFTDPFDAVDLYLSLVTMDLTGAVPAYVWPDGSKHDAY